jgi:formylglycine-generating enzyme required for sulfatase activity
MSGSRTRWRAAVDLAALLAATLTLALATPTAAAKPKRVAFIAGIATFDHLPASKQLAKPLIDAATMQRVLLGLGFAAADIVHLENPTQRQFLAGLDRFQKRLSKGDLAFVFVSTHGVNFRGANYLLPRDIPKPEPPINPADEEIRAEEERLSRYAISEAEIRDRILRSRAEAAIIVLDACRDNPLRVAEANNPFKAVRPGDLVFGAAAGLLETRGFGRPGPTRAGQTRFFGLYSAGYGQRALDHLPGDAASMPSPFTRVFAEKLPRPGIGIMATATDVTREVNTLVDARARHWQTPATYNDLIGRDIVLVPGPAKPEGTAPSLPAVPAAKPSTPPAPTTATAPSTQPSSHAASEQRGRDEAAAALWALVKGSRELAVIDSFIAAHGDTAAGAEARGWRRVLVDDAAMTAWAKLEKSEEEAAIARFIAAHRDTAAAAPARARLAALEKARAAREVREQRAATQWATIRSTSDVALVERFIAANAGTPAAVAAEAHRLSLLRARDPILALEPGSGKSARDRLKDGKDCPMCPEMVVVPAGEFRMGSSEGEAGRDGDEGPVRTVRIGAPFAVGKFEVTFAEWDACVAERGCTHKPGDQGWGRGRQPVINVSWDDARQYVAWLSGKTGKRYRLLTEAEWEYAARAGTQTRYSFGDSERQLGEHAWFSGNSGSRAQAVGGKQANAWGLHDMHGNVWEWVEDCYTDSYRGASTDGSANATGDCSRRVVRGGSWSNFPQLLRAAYRYGNPTVDRLYNIGFRLARSLSR